MALAAIRRGIAHLPGRWRLPCSYRLHLMEGCEPELRYVGRLAAGGGCAIDVGANVGWYTYAMTRFFDVVHSFEPNPAVTEALLAWRNPRVHVHHVALSNTRGTAPLRIPVMNGVSLAGWASLGEGRLPSGHEFRLLDVPIIRLDDLALQDVRLMKIDVERHETAVLEGARQTVARSRPVIILELDDCNRAAVDVFTRELGYRVTTLFEHIGAKPSPQNVLLIPG